MKNYNTHQEHLDALTEDSEDINNSITALYPVIGVLQKLLFEKQEEQFLLKKRINANDVIFREISVLLENQLSKKEEEK